ncbi:hypothetical protein B0A69_07355 [Chryseobacterium shigense]|uniref:Uncharacterized protein n=1 Tax=Chryseobacterium shigense TaxID=297244 RepID=A0A1N7I601_9FLAO|nr:hypothetical protein [Chryseobacterium shigense]PQA95250.1 hypothetical protein B0A69_07355 [Chryseobacterium shigense]SIS32507.1 hypothetical protein SAMN05421639_102243 [Chryseobacterium shigense]
MQSYQILPNHYLIIQEIIKTAGKHQPQRGDLAEDRMQSYQTLPDHYFKIPEIIKSAEKNQPQRGDLAEDRMQSYQVLPIIISTHSKSKLSQPRNDIKIKRDYLN